MARSSGLFVLLSLLCLGAAGLPAVVLNVRDFGAVGDGVTNDRAAIQRALDACGNYSSASSPCEVLVPPGRYLTGSLQFTASNTRLHLDVAAVLDASTLGADYGLTGPLPSYPVASHHNSDPRFQAVLSAASLHNISVVGAGVIDAHGSHFQKNSSQSGYQNPCVLEFLYCTNVLVRGVHILDGAYYHVHPYASQNVTVDGVTIVGTYHNADGIDPDSCRDVTITNCDITTSDDSISMKSGKGQQGVDFAVPTTNVRIENNRFYVGSGVAIGSEMSGGVADVLVTGNVFDAVVNVLRFKSCPHYQGVVQNVSFVDNKLRLAASAIFVDMNYECSDPDPALADPLFTNILVQDLAGDVVEAGAFGCLPGACTDWTLRNVSFAKHLVGYVPCEHVTGGRAIDCIPQPKCF